MLAAGCDATTLDGDPLDLVTPQDGQLLQRNSGTWGNVDVDTLAGACMTVSGGALTIAIGDGLTNSGGGLSVNAGSGLMFDAGLLEVDPSALKGAALAVQSDTLTINTGDGMMINGDELTVNAGTGLMFDASGQLVVSGAAAVDDVAFGATLGDVIDKVNELLQSLRGGSFLQP